MEENFEYIQLISELNISGNELIKLNDNINELKEKLKKINNKEYINKIEGDNNILLVIHFQNLEKIKEKREEIKNMELIKILNEEKISELKKENEILSKNGLLNKIKNDKIIEKDILKEEILINEEDIIIEENIVDDDNIIDEENIKNEENIIVDVKSLKKIINSGKEKCVCKIDIECKRKGKLVNITGTGFFCYIPSNKMKVLITNNHVLDQDFLNKTKIFNYYTYNNEKKEINLNNRYKYTDEKLDFTIIEMLEEDNIINFFEIDELINSKNYKNREIFCYQYPLGRDLKYSHGIHLGKFNDYFIYSIGTDKGSSGSPIILMENMKLIGLHKAGASKKKGNKDTKINIGIPMNLIINKIKDNKINGIFKNYDQENNYILCTYLITEKYVGKEILIINSEKNNEIKNKVKIFINGEYKSNIFRLKFNKAGYFNVYIMIDLSLTNMSYMFYECHYLYRIDLSNVKNNKIINMSDIFCNCYSLNEINISKLRTENVLNMASMFNGCFSLSEINLASFKTDSVKDMCGMFHRCYSLKKLDLSSFKTTNVIEMRGMFTACHSLTDIDLSSFQTDNVVNMNEMFLGCLSLKEINLLNFRTNKVSSMSAMFYGCSSLTKINLSSFTANSLTDMECMFFGCILLKEINLSSFNINKKVKLLGHLNRGVFENIPKSSKLICNDNILKDIFNTRKYDNEYISIGYEDNMCKKVI